MAPNLLSAWEAGLKPYPSVRLPADRASVSGQDGPRMLPGSYQGAPAQSLHGCNPVPSRY